MPAITARVQPHAEETSLAPAIRVNDELVSRRVIGIDGIEHHELQPLNDLKLYAIAYTRDRPGVMLLACFGLGFIAGWKLKPW